MMNSKIGQQHNPKANESAVRLERARGHRCLKSRTWARTTDMYQTRSNMMRVVDFAQTFEKKLRFVVGRSCVPWVERFCRSSSIACICASISCTGAAKVAAAMARKPRWAPYSNG